LAHVKNLIVEQRFDLRFSDHEYGDGFADCIEHFKAVSSFLSGRTLVLLDDRGDIAPDKAVLWKVLL